QNRLRRVFGRRRIERDKQQANHQGGRWNPAWLEIFQTGRIPSAALVIGLLFIAFNATTPKYTAESILDRISMRI
ncbi:hypothetical protein QCD79_31910, partial [Pseudomonas quasicaspiana]|nr:hypothetical protein [Pseudomonas quasicaspiana]